MRGPRSSPHARTPADSPAAGIPKYLDTGTPHRGIENHDNRSTQNRAMGGLLPAIFGKCSRSLARLLAQGIRFDPAHHRGGTEREPSPLPVWLLPHHGLRIPAALSVISMSYNPRLECCLPVPTMMRFPNRKAASHFKKWLAGGMQPTDMHLFPHHMIHGGSVAKAPRG